MSSYKHEGLRLNLYHPQKKLTVSVHACNPGVPVSVHACNPGAQDRQRYSWGLLAYQSSEGPDSVEDPVPKDKVEPLRRIPDASLWPVYAYTWMPT